MIQILMPSRFTNLILMLATLWLGFSLTARAESLSIVASIKPVELLVAAISADIQQPSLLIAANSSPHDFQLKPSERRKLQQADLVFWIGPEMEMALSKPLQQLDSNTTVIALKTSNDAADADHQGTDHSEHDHHNDHDDHKNGNHAKDEHEHEHEEHSQHDSHDDHHDHHAGHDHGDDLHIWLSPEQALRMAKLISDELSRRDPSNQAAYQANLTKFSQQLATVDQKLKQQLKPVSEQGYFVFHDAYHGFEAHYGLNHLGAFTLSPERRPGARHLAEIREQIKQQNAVCVFSEPQFKSSLVDNLAEGTEVRSGELDPLGSGINADRNGYFNLLQSLANEFDRCLSPHNTES